MRIIIALFLFFTVVGTSLWAGLPCTDPADCRGRLTFSTGKKIPYYRNFPLNIRNVRITRAIIVIHGTNRNADDYFKYVVNAAAAEGKLESTLILAPQFQAKADNPRQGEHLWEKDWRGGASSQGTPRFSSFSVIDEIYRKITATGYFKNLKVIILAGHSAGGQFVNRYAAGGRGPGTPGVRTLFLVMNPSSYLYIDGRRYVRGGGFVVPKSAAPGYNTYKYGLISLNSYMQAQGIETIVSNITGRRTYYLAGTRDTGEKNLDKRPQAVFQGKTRYDRWKKYRSYTKLFPGWPENAVFLTVNGIGHSGEKMFNSYEAKKILFDLN